MGNDWKPAGVTSANIRGWRQTQLSRRNAFIPSAESGPEIIRVGAIGKRSATQVLMEKEASTPDSGSGKSK
jgi:hypothetical protein